MWKRYRTGKRSLTDFMFLASIITELLPLQASANLMVGLACIILLTASAIRKLIRLANNYVQ